MPLSGQRSGRRPDRGAQQHPNENVQGLVHDLLGTTLSTLVSVDVRLRGTGSCFTGGSTFCRRAATGPGRLTGNVIGPFAAEWHPAVPQVGADFSSQLV